MWPQFVLNGGRFSNRGGTLDFFGSGDSVKELFPEENYTSLQFTFQISDHFPIWIQINTDIDGQRLDQIVQDSREGAILSAAHS